MANTETPAAAKAETTTKYHPCNCLLGTGKQCDGVTLKAFARGHDARMASRVAQSLADDKLSTDKAEKLIREAGGGDLLVSKMVHSAKLRQEHKQNPPKTRKAKKEAKAPRSQEESADAKAPAGQVTGKEVPVQHGTRQFKAVVVRDAGGELRARHRFQGKDCDHELEV